MKNYKLYIVGGFVRDKLLGIKSKDVDYAFEFDEETIEANKLFGPDEMYKNMNRELKNEGFEIFLEVPECFTTRAKFPKGHLNENLVADFVMCRKESYPDPTSRTPVVEMGNLYDDLARRDFKVNAMAISEDGVLIDPFDGAADLKANRLSCVKDAETSFSEDYLRMLRAIRFYITKGFQMDDDLYYGLQKYEYWDNLKNHVSTERIREEMYKCLKHDTIKTIRFISGLEEESGNILNSIFSDGLWLKPTTENK